MLNNPQLSTPESTVYVDKVSRLYALRNWNDLEKVENIVFNLTGVSSEEFRFKSRKKKYSEARWIAYYLLYDRFGWVLTKIGREYGYDHTTILHGVEKVRDDAVMLNAIENLVVSYPPIHRANSSSKGIN